HVGDVASRAEPRLVERMVAEMESIVRSRELSLRDHSIDSWADVFLVVDGWAGLRHDFEGLEDSITGLAVQGLSFGVHVVVSASRSGVMADLLRHRYRYCPREWTTTTWCVERVTNSAQASCSASRSVDYSRLQSISNAAR